MSVWVIIHWLIAHCRFFGGISAAFMAANEAVGDHFCAIFFSFVDMDLHLVWKFSLQISCNSVKILLANNIYPYAQRRLCLSVNLQGQYSK